MRAISFRVDASAGGGRVGVLTTHHGVIHTPAFVPVGTSASVRGVLPGALSALGAEVVLANTYHLYLEPGPEVVRNAGGVGPFMGWTGPTITDSGGFQVFSLGAAYNRTVSKVTRADLSTEEGVAVFDEDVQSQHGQLAIVDDEGVTFTSHRDGSLHRFTPERSVEIQHQLGADIFFVFDECTSPTAPYDYQQEAMYRTHRWAARSQAAHRANLRALANQSIFGIVQGGRHEALRRESAKTLAAMGFEGFGIGGSFSKEDMGASLTAALDVLPPEAPRHFLGIGEVEDVLTGISKGMDLFDCVLPTRLGRHGTVYSAHGPLRLSHERFRQDPRPLEALVEGAARTHLHAAGIASMTVGYLHHLVKVNELLAPVVASMHNLAFLLGLFADARAALAADRFAEYRAHCIRSYYHERT